MPNRLSRILSTALGPHGGDRDICSTCLGPRPCAGWLTLVGDEEPALCSTCGLPVHPDGRSAVSPGEGGPPVLHSIRLLHAERAEAAS